MTNQIGEIMHHTIGYVEPIAMSPGVIINSRILEEIVESPLVAACKDLYDKNIRTTYSSANRCGVEFRDCNGAIHIDYDTLSEENKAIADAHFGHRTINYGSTSYRITRVEIPLGSLDATVEEVSRTAIELVSVFKKQRMTWANTYTLQDLARISGCSESEASRLTPGTFSALDYFYDKETGLFYDNEEHFRKAHDLPIEPAK